MERLALNAELFEYLSFSHDYNN